MRTIPPICVLLALGCLCGAELTEDPPPAPKPKPGDVSGVITPSSEVAELYAVVRDTAKKYRPASFDRSSGRFRLADLPGDTRYDIGIKLRDGRTIEGINMDFVDQRLLRLAQARRTQLGLAPEPSREFARSDADELLRYAKDLKSNDFMDLSRVLYISGQGPRATMLIELMRTRQFHAQARTPAGPQVVWRVELWYFQNRHGAWQRLANQERVLRRERIGAEDWKKISIEYLPELSVQVDALGKSSPLKFTIPPKGDPSTGRLPRTAPDIQTAPHILGLASNDRPSTQTSQSAPADPAAGQ